MGGLFPGCGLWGACFLGVAYGGPVSWVWLMGGPVSWVWLMGGGPCFLGVAYGGACFLGVAYGGPCFLGVAYGGLWELIDQVHLFYPCQHKTVAESEVFVLTLCFINGHFVSLS